MKTDNVILSVKDLEVKFHVRGRILTAIRGISLDVHENESIAIVGESGSGKSVFTKTFAGMLDSNGFISKGDILFNDDALVETVLDYGAGERKTVEGIAAKLNKGAPSEAAASIWRRIEALKAENEKRFRLSEEDEKRIKTHIDELTYAKTELFNHRQTLDTSKEKDKIKQADAEIAALEKQIKEAEAEEKQLLTKRKAEAKADTAYIRAYEQKKRELENEHAKKIRDFTLTQQIRDENLVLAKEIFLSTGRIGGFRGAKLQRKLIGACLKAMRSGVDLNDEAARSDVFDNVIFRVKYVSEDGAHIRGKCILNLAKIREPSDWTQIRGKKIATVFQDPMTSLNPIIPIGKQITSIILKHQNCSETQARERALTLMKKVGIPEAEKRFDDYPFQYSGGMRQRIVIAIALSCQPKILICDEPTTALDVTIQAQILKLLKDLQKEFSFTIVFITHDLGVVANIADRVAVMYAGQIVELGKVDEVFFDPRHPYTWALLSSLPQLAERNTKLYSITGTPPSLYNKIVGDPFAPRNPYCMKIDTLKEPPVFRVTDTHFAKTWLLDPRSPAVEKPEAIRDIHEKLLRAFNI
ncbi:MAG: ATP-binding cassette domain-containing protein [Clostridia bacterium]|nr:ATP-binding cassette domain-containing protein [Clostridia bacterium]